MDSSSYLVTMIGAIVLACLAVFGLAAIVLRISIVWYNRLKGNQPLVATPVPTEPVNVRPVSTAPIRDDFNPYIATLAVTSPAQGQSALPMPSYGRALLIVFLNWLIQFGINFLLGIIISVSTQGEMPRWMISAMALPINFLIGAVTIHSLVPTPRFGQACLVQLLQMFIYLLIGLVFGGLALGISLFLMRQ